ncbi:uncharacterized protein BO97DRAFT_419996 [Aspergillus homomorphus CBS 101889]|uniref:Uncharacterized protein n=1 Tax=Aspergillus homomorphus (strain CBS 101889) TaxID=1450537 RepID=A0A395IDB8_ASPHC|nr:hypothetical protein BO97DRAFT_419996 [Aspergillus homomorphus CBS 101889]RAL17769.1 hypothetical protein BO97DRAFT_419996 [Aspergillus homomorphus CBS 101889]
MVQLSPTLGWLKENLELMKPGLRDMIAMDTYPMITDGSLVSRGSAELVADSFERTLKCLQYIHPQILILCQCCSKAGDEKWGSFSHPKAEELCSSEACARQEQVKTVDVYGHQMLVVHEVHLQDVVQYNQETEEVLNTIFTMVLGPFGQWKDRRLTVQREAARREYVMVKEGVREGMRGLIRQMQLFEHICGQEARNGVLSKATKRVEEWRKQMESWAKEMDAGGNESLKPQS